MDINGVSGPSAVQNTPPPETEDQKELDQDLEKLKKAIAALLGADPQSEADLRKYYTDINKVIDKVNEMIKNAGPGKNPFTENQMKEIFNEKTGICGNILKDDVSAQGSKAPNFFDKIVVYEPKNTPIPEIDERLLISALTSLTT